MTKKLVDEEFKTSKLEKRIKGLELQEARSQVDIDKLKIMTSIVGGLSGKLRMPETQTKLRDCGLPETLKDLELLDGLLELGIDIAAGESQLEANSDDEALAMQELFD